MYETSFHDVNTNNASSGLREKSYTYQFGAKIWQENIGTKMKVRRGEGSALGGPYLPKKKLPNW